MDKPEVEKIEGLSPAISIEQNTSGTTPRSTVGTVTEIHDYLRLLYARVGTQYSPETGNVVEEKSPEEIADEVLELPEGTKIKVLAPIQTENFERKLEELKDRGFTRINTDKEYDITLEEPDPAEEFEIVIDRIKAEKKFSFTSYRGPGISCRRIRWRGLYRDLGRYRGKPGGQDRDCRKKKFNAVF